MKSIAERLREQTSALKVERVCDLLDVSKIHVYRLVNDSRIPFMRLGGCIRFDPSELANWIERQSVPA